MNTLVEIARLKPYGTKVIVKRQPQSDTIKGYVIPEEFRTDKNAHAYAGTVIAVGGTDQERQVRSRTGSF